ncbi:hypothetical protein [Burkholderia catarinensis]|uniref:hypothetical protein n=1 Tax=Burkholderia catarinensis TaxID=1108140 RepID=UPI00091F9540|nr:hypothetical protein [Burkholderia catarinensis]
MAGRPGRHILDNRCSRKHERHFDGDVTVRASRSPHVVPKPVAIFSGECVPTDEEVSALHHAEHEECFLAYSVRSTSKGRGTIAVRRRATTIVDNRAG